MNADERAGDPRFVPELLFTDGLPAMDDEVGYRVVRDAFELPAVELEPDCIGMS